MKRVPGQGSQSGQTTAKEQTSRSTTEVTKETQTLDSQKHRSIKIGTNPKARTNENVAEEFIQDNLSDHHSTQSALIDRTMEKSIKAPSTPTDEPSTNPIAAQVVDNKSLESAAQPESDADDWGINWGDIGNNPSQLNRSNSTGSFDGECYLLDEDAILSTEKTRKVLSTLKKAQQNISQNVKPDDKVTNLDSKS